MRTCVFITENPNLPCNPRKSADRTTLGGPRGILTWSYAGRLSFKHSNCFTRHSRPASSLCLSLSGAREKWNNPDSSLSQGGPLGNARLVNAGRLEALELPIFFVSAPDFLGFRASLSPFQILLVFTPFGCKDLETQLRSIVCTF